MRRTFAGSADASGAIAAALAARDSLAELLDVNISSPSNGDLLVYHGPSGKWIKLTTAINLTATQAAGIADAATNLSENVSVALLTDVPALINATNARVNILATKLNGVIQTLETFALQATA